MPAKQTRAVIYTRISNDREGKAINVATQEQDCRDLALRHGLSVVGVYSDNDISASTNSRKVRPGWNQMLDDAEAGQFDVILAYTTSRLTRRGTEREELVALHHDHGTQFRFVQSPDPDLSTADGRQIFTVLGSSDTAEAERTSERVRRKHLELAQAGRHQGPRPYGWDIVGRGSDQRLVINPSEAAILRECVQRTLAGDGIWRIVKDLNERGVPSSTGKTWSTQVMRRTLLRWTNCGYRQHRPMKRGRATGEVTLYEGQWEPIIDRPTHERVVALLTDPARRSNNRGTEAKYLLTSVAYCGECGGHVVGTNEFTYTLKSGKTRVYPHSYKCPRSGCMKVQRRMADVDEHVTRVLLGVLERDGVRLLGGDPIASEQAQTRIDALEAKLALAADQFADDVITGEQLARITERLRPELDVERKKLRQAQPSADTDAFAGSGAAEAWAAADVERRKTLIRQLGMRITINRVGPGNGRGYDPDSVEITWERPATL